MAWGAVCVLEVAVRVSHGCNQIFLSAMGSKGVEMRINAKLVTDGPINWPKVAPRLFDANGEVRVGDVVHFNKKPCFVERIGELITLTTMDERRCTLNVLPHQIDCVLQRGDKR